MSGDEALFNLILIHFMISLRFLAMIFTFTVFTLPAMPAQAKAWVSITLSIIVTPLVNVSIPSLLLGSVMMTLVMSAREFLIGASIGIIAGLPLYALQVSGYLDGMFMGFSMINMFDPLSSAQTSVMAQVKFLVAAWFFFYWNGHILIIQALSESVRLIPPGVGMWARAREIPWLDWLQRLFSIALRLNLPVVGSVLLADVGLGFVARTVPQMNVFVLGVPMKIAVGLFVLLAVLPSCVDILHSEIERALVYALEGVFFWR
jgi:flagellar biosynthetic protein FliR